jgi:hypothetical protein
MSPSVEEQLHAYATAVLEDRSPEAAASYDDGRSASAAHRPHRAGFVLAAACLALVLAVGAVLALRSADSDREPEVPATTVVTSGPLQGEMSVSSTAPGSDDEVTVVITVTNISDVEVEGPPECSLGFSVSAAPRNIEGAPEVGTQQTWRGLGTLPPHELRNQIRSAAAGRPDLIDAPLEYEEVLRGLDAPDAPSEPPPTTCTGPGPLLAPDEQVTATTEVAIGERRLPAGPGLISAQIYSEATSSDGPLNLGVPITLPDPGDDRIPAADAVEIALALPEVQDRLETLPSRYPELEGYVPGEGADPPQVTSSGATETFVHEVPDGWQIGYIQVNAGFLVTVAADGSVTQVEVR